VRQALVMNTAQDPRVVVVADDEPEIRSILSDFLGLHGLAVAEATDGVQLLALVERSQPVAVIVDINMPRLGGLDAVRRIRSAHPSLPILVVTGAAEEARAGALAAGATAVLAKPLPLGDLLAALGLAEASPTAVAPLRATAEPAANVAGIRGRVVVVDDDPEVRAVLVDLLEMRGHSVVAVGNAEDAARAVVEHRPDVMLLDIYMPELTGVDALPILKGMSPDMRVIMVSGSTDEEAARRTLAWGAFDYILKPVDIDRLAQIVDTALLT
jgi:CheY-like chemotaxis protein